MSEANPILIDLPAISSDVQFPVNISELYGLIVGLCPMSQKCVSDIFACISASLNAYTKFKTKKIVPQVTVNGIIASSLLYFSMDAFIAFTLRYIFSPRKSIFEFATFLSEYAEKCSKSYTYLLMSDNATVVQKKKAARIIGTLSKNDGDQYSDPDDDDDEDRNDEDALNFDDSDIGEEQKH